MPLNDRLVPLMLPDSFVPFAHEMSMVHEDDCTTVQLLSWHEPPIDHLPLKSLEQLPAPPLLVLPLDVPLHATTRHPTTTTTTPTMLRFIQGPPRGRGCPTTRGGVKARTDDTGQNLRTIAFLTSASVVLIVVGGALSYRTVARNFSARRLPIAVETAVSKRTRVSSNAPQRGWT